MKILNYDLVKIKEKEINYLVDCEDRVQLFHLILFFTINYLLINTYNQNYVFIIIKLRLVRYNATSEGLSAELLLKSLNSASAFDVN